jgi:hypothetical protein
MTKNKILLCSFVLVILLSACAPDPRNQADAEATSIQAQQDAADQAQKRSQQQAEWELKLAERARITEQMVAALKVTLRFATIAAALGLSGWGIGLGIAGVRIGQAFGQAANLRANQIELNQKTGQYPLLQYVGRGYVSLTNPNNGETLLLNTANPADRERIAAVGQVQLAGVITRNAASHKTRPEGVTALGWYQAQVHDDG